MKFTFASFGLRFLFSIVLIFSSFNPEGYSYYHWVEQSFPSLSVEQAFVGVALMIAWVIYIRATMRSLGFIGITLSMLFFGLLIAMLFKWGWLDMDSSKLVSYIIEILLAVVLALGMSWSHLRKKWSGQLDTDDVDE